MPVEHGIGPEPSSWIIVSEYNRDGSFYLELTIAEMIDNAAGFERDFRAGVLTTVSSVKGVTQVLPDDRHTWAIETERRFKPVELVRAVKSQLYQGKTGKAMMRYLLSLMDPT